MLVRPTTFAVPALATYAVPALAVLGGILIASPAVAQTAIRITPTEQVIVAPSAPPPPRVETIPPPTGSETSALYWRLGHWEWNGANWAWAPGTYVQRPAPQAVWEPGHWVQRPGGSYVWVEGHWQG